MPANSVAIMAKMPQFGRVKTRLAAGIGDKKALSIYRTLLTNVISNTQPATDSSFTVGAYVAPADALILISTPAGSDNLFNASIVFPVG